MKNILDDIVAERRRTVKNLRSIVPVSACESMPFFTKKCVSLKAILANEYKAGIIAEFKRASPSRGIINGLAGVADVVDDYEKNGASGVSILTEPLFFNGNNDDILICAGSLSIPILRKDFIIDGYQVIESKALGADVILLIAAVLTKAETMQFAKLAHELGMEVLLEVHNEMELDWINDDVDIIGINNRNLKTFEVDINTSLVLGDKISADKIKISESGIHDVETIWLLRSKGFKGFLMGENFMKETDPGKAFGDFVQQLKQTT